MRVRVHFNLHRGDFSVVDPKTRRVIGNVGAIMLRDVTFHVSEKGRQRVIRSGKRAVHAYAMGTIGETGTPIAALVSNSTPCTYNPYRAGHFHPVDQPDKPIWQAAVVTFFGRYCWINSVTQ